MRKRTRTLRALCALLATGCLLLLFTGQVSATTGATSPTPARYKVALNKAQLFRGQYDLMAPAAKLISGGMAIDLNEIDYLFGIMQLRSYDAKGHQTTIVGGLYNFHLVSPGHMQATLYNSSDTISLGNMAVTQQANGDLVGQLTLGHQIYTVHWLKKHSL